MAGSSDGKQDEESEEPERKKQKTTSRREKVERKRIPPGGSRSPRMTRARTAAIGAGARSEKSPLPQDYSRSPSSESLTGAATREQIRQLLGFKDDEEEDSDGDLPDEASIMHRELMATSNATQQDLQAYDDKTLPTANEDQRALAEPIEDTNPVLPTVDEPTGSTLHSEIGHRTTSVESHGARKRRRADETEVVDATVHEGAEDRRKRTKVDAAGTAISRGT